jgi:hypothetical protein
VVDDNGTLNPGLKLELSAEELNNWVNTQAQLFGGYSTLENYPSDAGKTQPRILIRHPSFPPNQQAAEIYLSDKDEWWVQHYSNELNNPNGRVIAYHIYTQLENEIIPSQSKKKRRLGRPPLRTAN